MLLQMLAEHKFVDFPALVSKLDTVYTEQYDYEERWLGAREFKDTPQGQFMRSMLSLSFKGLSEIPTNDTCYHELWDMLESHDIEDVEYDEDNDIVAHLVQIMPQSTEKALDYYRDSGNRFCTEQRQHILSMSLSALKFPEGLASLIYAVYDNAHSEASRREGIELLNLMNPATRILDVYMTLYDNPQDMVKSLGTLGDIKAAFDAADAQRNKENANEYVAQVLNGPV